MSKNSTVSNNKIEPATTLLIEALELTPDAFAIFNATDRLIYCNQAWGELFAMDAKQAIGLTFNQLVKHAFYQTSGIKIDLNMHDHETELDLWLEKAQQKRRSQPFRHFEIDLKNGDWFLVSEQCFNQNYLFTYATNISATKKLESDLQKTNQEMQQLAMTDQLTDLANRHAFFKHAEHEFAKHIISGEMLVVFMFDLDLFKQINDKYGHLCGDRVLTTFANLLKREIRDSDLCARFGGEEFIALLPKCSIKSATLIAERIRKTFSKIQFEHNKQTFSVTVSIGISTNKNHTQLTQLISEADKQLYLAKQNGRNCIFSLAP